MKIYTLYGGGYSSASYLVTDNASQNGVLIDPSVPYADVIARVSSLPKLSAILLTHGHFDHMLSLDEWREKTGAPVCICREDACMLTDPSLSCYRSFLGTDTVHAEADKLLEEGDEIRFGEERVKVFKAPGHTAGSCVYIGEGVLFTGDTIFASGGYGRYDLPSGSAAHLFESIRRIFTTFPENYRIYPGHGGPSALSEERPYHRI